MRTLVMNTEGDEVSVREILSAVGRRAYGPVLLLLGFVAVSLLTIVPGANWFVATLTLIFALQIVVGRKTPWLPAKLLDVRLKRDLLVTSARAGEKYAHMLYALVKPRLVFLTAAPFVQFVGLVCVMAALVIYPLGLFPLGPLLPSLAVLLLGLALVARDGVVVLLAVATFSGSLVLLVKMLPRVSQLWPF